MNPSGTLACLDVEGHCVMSAQSQGLCGWGHMHCVLLWSPLQARHLIHGPPKKCGE